MLSSTFLLVATALAGLVHAQNYSTSGPLTVNPDTVMPQIRAAWCTAQIHNCPLICGSNTIASPNTCDANALQYTCTCANGNMPNITNYANTMPSYICGQWKALCVQAHPNDLIGQNGCLSVQCGNATVEDAATSTNAGSGNGAMTTMTASVTVASTAMTSATSTPSSSPSPSSAAVAPLYVGSVYTSGLTAAGLLAIFGLVL